MQQFTSPFHPPHNWQVHVPLYIQLKHMAKGDIVLIEDNEDDELLILRALAKCCISDDVVVLRDGAEALCYLLGPDARHKTAGLPLPRVVLLDLMIPKLSGFEVLKRIKQDPEGRQIPIVVLTSSREESDVTRSYMLGANSYVRKPVDFEDLERAVGSLRHYWLEVNERPGRTEV